MIFLIFPSSPVPTSISRQFLYSTSSPSQSRAASPAKTSPSTPRLTPLPPRPPSRPLSAPGSRSTMCPISGKKKKKEVSWQCRRRRNHFLTVVMYSVKPGLFSTLAVRVEDVTQTTKFRKVQSSWVHSFGFSRTKEVP